MYRPTLKPIPRKVVDIPQPNFNKGYISTLADSRLPLDALSDATNAILDQDGLPRPRPSLVAYGQPMLGTCLGISTFIKVVSGVPERWEISMQVVSGAGKICVRKDGGTWTNVGGSYSATALVSFAQAGKLNAGTLQQRVYIANGVDNLSYYNIDSGALVNYTSLTTPSAPTVTPTGLTGTNFTYYYKISANNAGGESTASASGNSQVSKLRDQWVAASEYIDVSWSSVAGATSYNVYMGDISGNEVYLATVNGLTYRDDGTQAPNPFKLFPVSNSTAGPKVKYLIAQNDQIFGCGDADDPYKLWYGGTGTHSGDFSFGGGGGWVGIGYGSDAVPVYVRPFRDGRGTPVLTILSKGSAGQGRIHHMTFTTTNYGDTTVIFPSVYEAGGQSGTISPRGVVEANSSLWYPTGTAFKTTGSKPNLVNILSTDSVSQGIEPDVKALNLAAMEKCVGLEFENKIYWALPYGSSENTEIWILDLSRRGAWILRWRVAAKFLWLYEDNSGVTHFCALVNNKVLEFTRNVGETTDDGVAFSTRVAGGALVFDKAGVSMAQIDVMRFKFLNPKGTIRVNVSGLTEEGDNNTLGHVSYSSAASLTFTGWGQLLWSNEDGSSKWSDDVGLIDSYTVPLKVLPIEIDEIVNQVEWEVLTDSADTDYLLAAAHTHGYLIPNLYYGDDEL